MIELSISRNTTMPILANYDGSYVENHCTECGEFDSECVCDAGLED